MAEDEYADFNGACVHVDQIVRDALGMREGFTAQYAFGLILGCMEDEVLGFGAPEAFESSSDPDAFSRDYVACMNVEEFASSVAPLTPPVTGDAGLAVGR